MIDRNAFWAKCEELGEEEVRKRIVSGWNEEKRRIALQWLAYKASEREGRLVKEAEEANRHARTANWISCIAACVAALSLLITLFHACPAR